MSTAHTIPLDQARDLMACPTCGARQPPADACRRCRSDLSMVRAARGQYEKTRRQCLALLANRRLKRAAEAARAAWAQSHDDDSLRLLATCYLMQGSFADAVQLYVKTCVRDGRGSGGDRPSGRYPPDVQR